MFSWLTRWFPKVGKRAAMRIAQEHCFPDLRQFHHPAKGAREPRFYNRPLEPHWIIHAPWLDGLDGSCLRSSRVILVSKISGRVLYDGDAGDEG